MVDPVVEVKDEDADDATPWRVDQKEEEEIAVFEDEEEGIAAAVIVADAFWRELGTEFFGLLGELEVMESFMWTNPDRNPSILGQLEPCLLSIQLPVVSWMLHDWIGYPATGRIKRPYHLAIDFYLRILLDP